MSEIYVIPQITLTDKGPAVTGKIDPDRPKLIHLQQGSLDGACGPYSFCMALVILGFEKHSKLSNLEPTNSSRKLFKLISDHSSALITEGTELNVLAKYAKPYKGLLTEKITADFHGNSQQAKEGKKKSYNRVRDFIVKHVLLKRPVILGTVAHYSLVVGLGFEDKTSRDNEIPRYLFLLDPNVPAPIHSAWNGVIDLGVKGNNWFGTGGCNIEGALALWKEK